ncbi:MAG: YgaP family membrane protein [Chitinophagaceae bacterium]
MKKNLGGLDKMVRIILATVAAYLYLNHHVEGTLGYVVLAFGAIMLITSLISFCPLYRILNISSCQLKKA